MDLSRLELTLAGFLIGGITVMVLNHYTQGSDDAHEPLPFEPPVCDELCDQPTDVDRDELISSTVLTVANLPGGYGANLMDHGLSADAPVHFFNYNEDCIVVCSDELPGPMAFSRNQAAPCGDLALCYANQHHHLECGWP